MSGVSIRILDIIPYVQIDRIALQSFYRPRLPARLSIVKAAQSPRSELVLRIVHVPHAYHPVIGGTEVTCKRISEILAAQSHEVHVITTNVGAVQGYYQYGIEGIDPPEETIAGVRI